MSNNIYGNGHTNGDMFNNERSNGSMHGGGMYGGLGVNGLNRQTSRHFAEQQPRQQYPASSMYTEDDRVSSYEPRTVDRSVSQHYGHQQYNSTFDPPAALWSNHSPQHQYSSTAPRMRSVPRGGRPALPSQWSAEPPLPQHGLQQQQQHHQAMQPSMAPMNGYGGGSSNGMSTSYPVSSIGNGVDDEDEDNEELIPTAIVIKNIPFAVKREQLAALMAELGLPAPYAFNYHFDSGVFRGLAFANFQNPHDTATVINAMNHMELQGRKLRVEYKKMLPQQERERIEREKRLRRGQLEEQHRPVNEPQARQLNMQPSYSSLSSPHIPGTSQSPSPVSHRSNGHQLPQEGSALNGFKLDFNDPWTLDQNEEIAVFRRDESRVVYIVPAPLTDQQRRIIHELAHSKGLYHDTIPTDSGKAIQISKTNPKDLMMNAGQYGSNSTSHAGPSAHGNGNRTLGRAATTENFTLAESSVPGLRSQNSAYLAPFTDNIHGQSLRGAKSFGDLQNRGPSPANSQGFPSILGDNANYVRNLYANGNSSASNLSNQFSSMSLSNGLTGPPISRLETSASRLGAVGSNNAGAIGSHRSINNLSSVHDDHQSRTVTSRQPIGPSEWNTRQPFTRNRQRGSHDLDAESTDSLDSPISGPNSARYPPSRN